jgi:malonyl-CoA O-methyltransferase
MSSQPKDPRGAPSGVEHLPTQAGYDRWAEIYDEDDNPLVAVEQPRVAGLLGDLAGRDVVDVGCGTGRHTAWLSAGGARVTAIDFSAGMLARATSRTYSNPVRFLEHDLTKPLPLADAAFDRVLSGLVVDHIPDLASHFGELLRICRPDGLVVISVLHPAMMLKGVRARFRDPESGAEVRPASCAHQISDYVMAAVRSGAQLAHLSEHVVDAALARRSERAAKYEGWPILLLMSLRPRS